MSDMKQINVVNPNDMRAGIIYDLDQKVPITSMDQLIPVKFDKPFPKDSTVIVLSYLQTAKGGQTEPIRIHDVTNKGFRIGYYALWGSDEQGKNMMLSDGRHIPENIGWLAIRLQ